MVHIIVIQCLSTKGVSSFAEDHEVQGGPDSDDQHNSDHLSDHVLGNARFPKRFLDD